MKNHGSSLVFVLMITSLLFIFGISLLGLSLSEYKMTNAYADFTKADYAAESGLNDVKYYFISHKNDILSSDSSAIDSNHNNKIDDSERNYAIKSYINDLYKKQFCNDNSPKSIEIGDVSFKVKEFNVDVSGVTNVTINYLVVGTYKNTKRSGEAKLIYNFYNNGDEMATVQKWEISSDKISE